MNVKEGILKLIENINYLENLGLGKASKQEAEEATVGLNKLLNTLSKEELEKELKETV